MDAISPSEINRAQSLVLEKLKKKNLSGLLAAQRNGTLQDFIRPELEAHLKKAYPNKIIPNLSDSKTNEDDSNRTVNRLSQSDIETNSSSNNTLNVTNEQNEKKSTNSSSIAPMKTNKQVGSGLATRMAAFNSNIPMPGSAPPPNIKKVTQNTSFEPTVMQLPLKHSATRAKRLRSDAEFGEIVNVNMYRPILHDNPVIHRKTPGRRHSLITGEEYKLISIQLENDVERESTGTRMRPSFSNSDLSNYLDVNTVLSNDRLSININRSSMSNHNSNNNNNNNIDNQSGEKQNTSINSLSVDNKSNLINSSNENVTTLTNSITPKFHDSTSTSTSNSSDSHNNNNSIIKTETNNHEISNHKINFENDSESKQTEDVSRDDNSKNIIHDHSQDSINDKTNISQNNPLLPNELHHFETTSQNEKLISIENVLNKKESDSQENTLLETNSHPTTSTLSSSSSSSISTTGTEIIVENHEKSQLQTDVQTLSRSPLHQSSSQTIGEGDQNQVSVSSSSPSTESQSNQQNLSEKSSKNQSSQPSETSSSTSCCCIS